MPKGAVLGGYNTSDGLMYVVSEAQVRYRTPAKLDDELQVRTRIVKVGGATLDFQQSVWREDTLIAEANVRVACADQASGRPRRLPSAVRDAIDQYSVGEPSR